ncbi:VCBS repeat-containing protein [Ekhidna sp.]
MKKYWRYFSCIALLSILSCESEERVDGQAGFSKVSPEASGIHFVNELTETDTFNYFTYPYIYMGGGVALVDLNNDELLDVYFTGNMVSDQIYLNKGDLKFEDITESVGLSYDKKWHTGVTVVDINEDGLQDIYVSVSGPQENRKNLLYINEGELQFSEQAAEYGIADNGNSIQSTFFDYDNDGDLDLYVANYPITSFKTPNFKYKYLMNTVTEEKSDRLYRNDGNGKYVDATREAGLLSFGLSISATVADFNNDGWQDIYVSNDFSTPDYFFINNGDGTFTDQLKSTTKQTSFYSMGADAADINNDGLTDFFQVDMSAEDNRRSKANMASMDVSLFWSTVNNGFHYQYMYNTLQLNRGVDNNLPVLSNIAALANVTSTDWSWAPLFADFNNDGWKDLFITNGTRREINNKDYFNAIESQRGKMTPQELLEAALNIPSEPVANYFYLNNKKIGFTNETESWNLDQKGFSNGSAYGDLDNDGDLDLVVNNIDSVSWIYKNTLNDQGKSNFLRVRLKGKSSNSYGIGSKITIYANGSQQTNHVMLSRGFQSSVEPISHFGLGSINSVDSIVVNWPDGGVSTIAGVQGNQTISIAQEESSDSEQPSSQNQTQFVARNESVDSLFIHKENNFNDYAFQVLMPHKMSNLGPALATGDINGDGLDDIFIGAAIGQNPKTYLQTSIGTFITAQTFEGENYENIDATFFDADNDGDLDLYVVNGGNEYDSLSGNYQDQLFLNEDGQLIESASLPKFYSSGGCIRPFDFDNDGDLDLFVGGRLSPRHYPFPGTSHLLVNKLETGTLTFEDQTQELAPTISKAGMVTDALWMDVNNDKVEDLIVAGEWMDVLWFENTGERLLPPQTLVADSKGWWFSLESGDIDNDGDQDLILGNLGKNYKYKASLEEPFDVFVKDFDLNGKDDIVLSYYNFGAQFPVRGRQCSSQQIPALKSAFKDYNSFSTATVQDIFGTDALSSSLHYSANTFASKYLQNNGDGSFTALDLPEIAQISPVNDIQILDVNGDENLDVLLIGNLHASEVETPRADAGIGLLMLGSGNGEFTPVSMNESGLIIKHDAKHSSVIEMNGRAALVIANNNGPMQIYQKSSE